METEIKEARSEEIKKANEIAQSECNGLLSDCSYKKLVDALWDIVGDIEDDKVGRIELLLLDLEVIE